MSYQLTLSIPRPPVNWRPPEPPSLEGVDEVFLDCETSGLRFWDRDHLIGVAVRTPDGRSWYLPDSHRGGGNLGDGVLKRWLKTELRGKKITNLNTRFDNHNIYNFGVDLEEQGCTLSDVGVWAALLDDHRQKFSLESIARDYVGEGKTTGLDATRMEHYHAGEVEGYARQDVRLVHLVRDKMLPMIRDQQLEEVQQLEDDLIFVVCEMERNGAPIDVELLEKWCVETEQKSLRLLWEIHRETGVRVNPSSPGDIAKLFRVLGIESTETTETGQPSYDDLALKQISHPVVVKLRRARRILSIRSKYLLKYRSETAREPLIRYALHQLKTDYENMGRGGGTVSGRFSSSGFGTRVAPDGVNIQQVMTTEKARAAFGYDPSDDSHDDEVYSIRRLYVPASGLWYCADANQIEYRLFAHYSAAPVILQAYRDNPDANFHKLVQAMIQKIRADIPYRRTKDINFAKIFGAGLPKIAAMMEMSQEEARSFVRDYDKMLPEVNVLIKKAINAAETRGYVRTLLGRRMRFPNRERTHKALNGVIQGGAADWNKMKLLELHRERRRTGFKMRFTVHDEANGDVPDLESARMVTEILNRQTMKLRVPITWSAGTGRNWAEAKENS